MLFETFRQILVRLSIALDDQPNPSAHKNPKSEMLGDEWTSESHWRSNSIAATALTPRTRAFLLAYVAASGPSFPARGIHLDGHWVHPDKGIMKAMLNGGYFRFVTGDTEEFQMTLQGRDFLLGSPNSIQ